MIVRGGWFLLVFMLGLTFYDLGRIAFPEEKFPALFVPTHNPIRILVRGLGRNLDGIHQINDASELLSVIKLAELSVAEDLQPEISNGDHVSDGKTITLQLVSNVVSSAEFEPMPAAMRMALGIPLDVNQMSPSDWDDLPGVGASLALRINDYRQENGEFGLLEGLTRVNGVGKRHVDSWRQFFQID